MKKGKTNRSSDDDAAAAPLVAGNDGSRSSVARPHLSSSPTVLARAGLVVAEVVRHLHRVHQRGATAVLVLVLVEERKRVFYFCFEEERFLSLSLLSFSLSPSLFSLNLCKFRKFSYLHLAIDSVLRTYLPELRIPRRWSDDCERVLRVF